MKSDIANRADIELLVNSFYEKVKLDDTIGFIFTDVAKLDWEKHLPKMYSFWESLLLDKQTFVGNPMLKHLILSQKIPLTTKEFDQWFALWQATVDEFFLGAKAEEAKLRARSIADVMLGKISQSKSGKGLTLS